jgi:2-methylcitrate dehydratase PrpD
MPYLDTLARFAAEVSLARLGEAATTAARLVLLDTLGAMLAGSAQPENVRLARAMAERASRPAATLIGHDARVDPLLATLVNATAGVALEVDEGNRWGGGHPAIHVVPGALAVAEERGADGVRLLEAIVAGYEVSSRIGGSHRAPSRTCIRTGPGAPSAPRWPWRGSRAWTRAPCERSSTWPRA